MIEEVREGSDVMRVGRVLQEEASVIGGPKIMQPVGY